jgi:uncharacterized protein (TIGR02118 family)
MYKLVACWTAPKPEDLDAFERHYLDVHAPLASRVPELRRLVLTRTDSGLEGAAPAFHRVAEMGFDSPDALARSAHSEAWQRMRADAGAMMSRFGVGLQVAMGWEQDASPSAA